MMKSLKLAKKFLNDDSAATAVEYTLIAAFIALVLVIALGALGNDLGNTFNQVANGF